MTQSQQIHEDLQFVRQAVDRCSRSDTTPHLIAWIWGLFILVSFTLLDVHFPAAMWMFAVGAPICGVASGFIGRSVAMREGVTDRREAAAQALHWGSIFVAMLALSALAALGRVRGDGIGQVATLIVGVVYFLGGVHFDRRWMISGILLMVGSVAITFIHHWAWTALGVVVCLGLILPTFLRKPQ
jgi:hypothetical protein